jgi:hypothetical protein
MPTTQLIDSLSHTVSEEIVVRAPIETTFESLITQVGRANETPDGKPFPMVLETWPGGRWYRDLGGDNGHHWGHVQAIKRPTLLEIYGPLFMSYPVTSNMQYRLSEVAEGTKIVFRHSIFGPFPDEVREQIGAGWRAWLTRIQRAAERADQR